MYDHWFASTTLGSASFRKRARKETHFLISALGIKRGERILDVPCGTGRHSVLFARNGLYVVGVDINTSCLKIAKEVCKSVKVTLRKGDMSKLSLYRGRFDAVVNLYTSFGYFSSDRRNEQVLRELISTLKSGGQIALQLVNRDWLLKSFRFRPTEWKCRNGKFVLEDRRYDRATKYEESQLMVLDQRTRKAKVYRHRVRLYSKPEMVSMMKRCGLVDIRVFGDFDGGPYRRFESRHPFYIGRKPK
jgi:ubiquinone/menaquinone biosynthesis C-methylase UbiE